MKKALLLAAGLSIVSTLQIYGAEDKLENLLPQNTSAMVYVDTNRVLKSNMLAELKKSDPDFSSKYNSLEAKLNAQGVSLDKLMTSAMVFMLEDGNSGMIARTGVPEDKLESILKSGSLGDASYTVEKGVGNRKLFVFKENASKQLMDMDKLQLSSMVSKGSKDAALTYLKPDLVLISDYAGSKALTAMFENSTGPKKALLDKKASSVSAGSLVWAVFDMPKKAKAAGAQPAPMGMDPSESISGGTLCANFSGATGEDLSADASIDFYEAQNASMFAMQIQGLMMMISGSAFPNDPQLGMDVVNAIKVKSQDKALKVSILLTKDLQQRFKAYAEKNAMNGNGAAPAGLPAPAKSNKLQGADVKAPATGKVN